MLLVWKKTFTAGRILSNMLAKGAIMCTVMDTVTDNYVCSDYMLPNAGDSQAYRHERGVRAHSNPASTAEN